MLVTHFTTFAPSKSGMYESTKDQIKYERREGLDSQLICTFHPDKHGMKDDWLETVEWRTAMDADVWVVHAGLPMPLKNYIEKSPEHRNRFVCVAIMHGPCENMFIKEYAYLLKGLEEQAFTETHIDAVWNYDACVVLNQHEYNISVLYDVNDKLVYIPNSIDLERYQPDGHAWEYNHRPAIISADVPRLEKLPVHIVFAMAKVLERVPEARLNFFGIPLDQVQFWRNLVCRAKNRHLDHDCIENYLMKTNTLTPFVRGADIGFNSNYSGIMSRVHMEMMAMGVPVVSYNGDYTPYHAKIFDLDSIAEQIERCWKDLNNSKKKLREKTIKYAHKHFDRSVYVKDYVKMYQKLKEEKNV